MKINQQSKVPMNTENVPSDPGASQGARRATEDAPGSAPSPIPPGSDSEVVPRARRRRRFLLHILPKGLMRVRHYGFLANRCRKVKLARIRRALHQPPPEASADPEAGHEPATYPCPRCRVGRVHVIQVLASRTRETNTEERRRC